MKRTAAAWLGVALLGGCVGPPAPDGALCRDVIERICIAPICVAVKQNLAPGEGCEEDLLARTGCAAEDFAFTAFSRERFLECRVPLLRTGRKAACDDIARSQETCPDVWLFLKGPAQ